jgi:hypothetical protein
MQGYKISTSHMLEHTRDISRGCIFFLMRRDSGWQAQECWNMLG